MTKNNERLTSPKKDIFYMSLLILAGEAVFVLPFVLARVFRPTVLEVFKINNTQLGLCFSTYGIVAVFSYLFGGPLADKYQPRKLMGIALVLTALGGLVMAQIPSLYSLTLLYGFWGFTTIFLFWSAMIKATRVWGGQKNQGKAFGFLDGGRGLVGALFGLMGVLIFSVFVADSEVDLNAAEQTQAFRRVIYISSAVVASIGFLVYFFLKTSKNAKLETFDRLSLKNIVSVLRLPVVWLLMLIILCAYVGYKITDIISLYAKDVMQFSEVDAAQTGTFLLFIRPVVGVVIGFLADKSRGSIYLCIGFLLSIVGAVLFASGVLNENMPIWFFISITITAIGVYAARVLYFAVLEEGKIPLILTGTAVGIVSFVGYTPEVFAGPVIGYFLDASPGIKGHQHVFWMLAYFSAIGFLASYAFFRITKNK